MTLSWINSLLPNNFKIFDLYRDLSDGIIVVELIESANAGCVEWKNWYTKTKSIINDSENVLEYDSLCDAFSYKAKYCIAEHCEYLGSSLELYNHVVDNGITFRSTISWSKEKTTK